MQFEHVLYGMRLHLPAPVIDNLGTPILGKIENVLRYQATFEKVAGFLGAVQREGLAPVSLGTVQEKKAVSVMTPAGTTVDVDVAHLRNLIYEVDGDMERFVREFVEAGKRWGLE